MYIVWHDEGENKEKLRGNKKSGQVEAKSLLRWHSFQFARQL